MFARVITARATDGFEGINDLARRQLPDAQQQPGFAGYYLLTDDDTGSVVVVSLWNSRDSMEAVADGSNNGVHDDGVVAAGLSEVRLDTYEVAVHG